MDKLAAKTDFIPLNFLQEVSFNTLINIRKMEIYFIPWDAKDAF